MEALILWESHYVDQPKYSWRYFIVDLTKSLHKEREAKSMLLNLLATMAKPEEELLPDPSHALNAYKQRRQIPQLSSRIIPEIEATKLLLDKWLTLANSPVAIDIGRFVEANIHRLTIDRELKIQTARWLRDHQQAITVNQIHISDLRKIINLFYIGFCEYLGPNRADTLLAEAVNRLKSNGGAAYSEFFAKIL